MANHTTSLALPVSLDELPSDALHVEESSGSGSRDQHYNHPLFMKNENHSIERILLTWFNSACDKNPVMLEQSTGCIVTQEADTENCSFRFVVFSSEFDFRF